MITNNSPTHFEPPSTQPATETSSSTDSDGEEEDSSELIEDMSTETVETDNQSSTYARSPAKKPDSLAQIHLYITPFSTPKRSGTMCSL